MQLFITGTDTAIGKTYFSSWLVRQWRTLGHHAAGIKPISCGGDEDAEALRAAGGNELTLHEVNAMRFPSPAAPLVAARADGMTLDWNAVTSSIAAARARFTHLAVEGVGGWLVPLDEKKTVREWAVEMNLPVVIVARAVLGTINHTLLTVESIEAAGLTVAGIVLNAGLPSDSSHPLARSTNAAVLVERTQRPVFVFDKEAENGGKLPQWLGGK